MKTPGRDRIIEYNREAWNEQVKNGNKWTIPVDGATIEKARHGEWNVVLTPNKFIPHSWFPDTPARLLGLASGGGQQGPVLAAAGFDVVVFDNSDLQLELDRSVSDSFGLDIKTDQGNMTDLSVYENGSFEAVFNPCSLIFSPDPERVFKEVFRVLKHGGVFLSGFSNPLNWLFDYKMVQKGKYHLRYRQPYSDIDALDQDDLKDLVEKNEPVVHGHSLEILLGGQLRAGLQLTHIIEDYGDEEDGLRDYYPGYIATRALKP